MCSRTGEQLQVTGHSKLTKQELIYKILDQQALTGVEEPKKKRRRGRPRKSEAEKKKAATKENEVVEENKQEEEVPVEPVLENTDSEPVVEKKKRNRKKIVKVSADDKLAAREKELEEVPYDGNGHDSRFPEDFENDYEREEKPQKESRQLFSTQRKTPDQNQKASSTSHRI